MTPSNNLMQSFQANQHRVCIYPAAQQAAAAAAEAVAAEMRRLIAGRDRAVGVFDAAPGVVAFLDCLAETGGIEWTRVIGFQLDEFVGVNEDSPRSTRRVLLDRLVCRVPMAEFHAIRGEAANPAAVCDNLAKLLRSRPPDFAVLELGAMPGLPESDAGPLQVIEPENAGCLIRMTRAAILACPRLFLLASGAEQAAAFHDWMVREWPRDAGADLFLDRAAAAELSLGEDGP
jgi:6-phosphogluconolactonase/glucosamine-6-phosphate isomerase/deaminase